LHDAELVAKHLAQSHADHRAIADEAHAAVIALEAKRSELERRIADTEAAISQGRTQLEAQAASLAASTAKLSREIEAARAGGEKAEEEVLVAELEKVCTFFL